jgi:hypothetical protein
MSSADKTKLDGIQAGAQVNAVTSVNSQTGAVSLTTSNISEGTNLYYTDSRFDTRLSTKSTTNLAEGTNLYFTNARADARTLGERDQVLNGFRSIDMNGDGLEFLNGASAVFGVDVSGFYGTGIIQFNGLYYPSADGTNGQVLKTNGTGTLSWVTKKVTQVTGKTVATGAWTLVSGFYEASISDSAILSTSIVDVIPDNGSAATVSTAEVLPRTDSSTGSVKIYANNAPAATITVTLNIFDL